MYFNTVFGTTYMCSQNQYEQKDHRGIANILNPNGHMMAEAVLKPMQGKSFLHSSEPVSSENINQFKVSNETIKKAKDLFRKSEIEVVQAGMTLTLMGLPEKFEALLDVKMIASKADSEGPQYLIPNKDPVIPEAMQPFVDAIVFPKPISIKP